MTVYVYGNFLCSCLKCKKSDSILLAQCLRPIYGQFTFNDILKFKCIFDTNREELAKRIARAIRRLVNRKKMKVFCEVILETGMPFFLLFPTF